MFCCGRVTKGAPEASGPWSWRQRCWCPPSSVGQSPARPAPGWRLSRGAAPLGWHGGSPRGTQDMLCRARARLDMVNPQSQLPLGQGCKDGMVTRLRGKGRELLEVAEAPED